MTTRGLIDRRTLLFIAARRLPEGVEFTARFDAPKSTSGEIGSYRLRVTIEPLHGGRCMPVSHHLGNRSGGGSVSFTHVSNDRINDLAEEAREVFLATPAWSLLRDRSPDRHFVVDGQGEPLPHTKRRFGLP